MEGKKELVDMIAKWSSLAVLMGFLLWGLFKVWTLQMDHSHELQMKMLEISQCKEQALREREGDNLE